MYRMRDIARKGLAPPVLLLLCLLINIWARWPILMHIDEVFTISWRVCTALVTGGISLVLSLTGLVTLISNQTTLNALHPERTSMLVTRGCFRFSRNSRILRELQNLDFIWLPRTAAPAWHDRLIHCFYDAGFTPRSVMHGVDAVSMLTLVSAGMGCTIVAEGMRHLAPSNVSFVVLEDLNIVQEWELVWRKDRCSEVLKSLINLI